MLVFIKPNAKKLITESLGWVGKMDELLCTIRKATSNKDGYYVQIESGNYWILNKECVIEVPEGHVVAKVRENFEKIDCDPNPAINPDMRKMAGNYYLFKQNNINHNWYLCQDQKNSWTFHEKWLDIAHSPNSNTKGPASPSATETMKEITATLDLTKSEYNLSVVVRNNKMFFRNGQYYKCPWGTEVLSFPGQSGDVVYKFDNGTDVFETLTAGRCLDKYKVVRASVEAEVRKLLEQGKIVARDCDGTKRLLELDDDGKVYGYTSNGDRSWCTFSNEKSKYYTFTNSVEMVKWLSKRS